MKAVTIAQGQRARLEAWIRGVMVNLEAELAEADNWLTPAERGETLTIGQRFLDGAVPLGEIKPVLLRALTIVRAARRRGWKDGAR